MSDLFEGAAPACPGYRLHKLEVYNWGTFDSQRGTVHAVRPGGATALLIGQNGSGKSTLVDAILTLLVSPNVRNYNVAAGARKRERDERSYIRGACGRLSRGDDNGTQVEYLRPGTRHYSVLLACFRNERGDAFTLAQVLYLGSERTVEKVYCYSDGERSIAEHCSVTGTERVRRQMEEQGFRATDKYTDYHLWLERKTGMLPKAMDMFNQTVAVKDIQSLNEFVRDHMLEAKPWGERIDGLQSHFTQLTEAHQSLVQARRQFDLLRPIAERGDEYRARAAAAAEATAVAAAVPWFFHEKRVELLVPFIEATRCALAAAALTKQGLEEEEAQAREEARGLQNKIERAGGDRLRALPLLIQNQEQAARAKRATHARFQAALSAAGLAAEVVDAPSLATLHASLPLVLQAVKAGAVEKQAARDRLVQERGELARRRDDDRRELEALGTRATKLPEELAEVHRRLCGDLGLREDEVPFAAELIAVDPQERAWEASAEKVLGGFARSLLVPDRLYSRIGPYLDRTRLQDGRGRGQRLVYLRVAGRTPRPNPPLNPRSLVRKLRLKDGHPLTPWLRAELEDRHDFLCCETVEEFQAAHGPAMTRERQVKWANGVRHEKDDRERSSDPRFFVLGWDNREKRRHLAAEVERLTGELGAVDHAAERLRDELVALESRRAAVEQLVGTTDFTEIDYWAHEQEALRLTEERRALEEGTEAVRTLKQRLAEVSARERELRDRRDEVVRSEQRLHEQVGQATTLVGTARRALDHARGTAELARHVDVFDRIASHFADSPLTAEDVVAREQPFQNARRDEAERLRAAAEPLKDELCGLMNRFIREFKEAQADLDARIEYLDGFCNRFEEIRRDDLPRHEQRFKERLNDNVLREVGFLYGAFGTEKVEIEAKVDLLNQSLRQLEYRPGTRMRLDPRPVRDADIADFQTSLKACLDGMADGPDAAADEARYLRVAKLLARLRDEERWRHKVTDVRRWFDFAAVEFDAETGAERHCYTDGSGQSGGEKAKLAFTILVAAIAYQYDIDPARPADDRFHFVVVDEMFSKVDDRYAEYALELFRKFGLQLLIVAPLDAKARVTEPYVGCYLHVSKDGRTNLSEVVAMTAREFEDALLTPASSR